MKYLVLLSALMLAGCGWSRPLTYAERWERHRVVPFGHRSVSSPSFVRWAGSPSAIR